jgi:hypothetical protein
MLRQEPASDALHPLNSAAQRVTDVLLPFSRKVYGAECLSDAWHDFRAGEPKEDLAGPTPYLQLFIPWFMYRRYPEGFDFNRLRNELGLEAE